MISHSPRAQKLKKILQQLQEEKKKKKKKKNSLLDSDQAWKILTAEVSFSESRGLNEVVSQPLLVSVMQLF